MTWWSSLSMDASKSLSCENNNSSLFSAVPDSSNMYQNKDSNLISDLQTIFKELHDSNKILPPGNWHTWPKRHYSMPASPVFDLLLHTDCPDVSQQKHNAPSSKEDTPWHPTDNDMVTNELSYMKHLETVNSKH